VSQDNQPQVQEPGTLLVVATPIGNLEDITTRALRALREADLIVAEDTRHTLRLLNHFGIRKPMLSCHDRNEQARVAGLLERLRAGERLVLVSDAGTPGLSDPGEILIRHAVEAGFPVSMAPGPAAAVMGLVLSGLPTQRFCFEGFLPASHPERVRHLESLRGETRTMVFYEAPHRVAASLRDMLEVLGDRKGALARELTKRHEEVIRLPLSLLLAHEAVVAPRGEFVVVVEGMDRLQLEQQAQSLWQEMPVHAHVRMYEAQGYARMDAMKRAARERGLSKREVYAALQDDSGEPQ
jgi:16S rRNA (cytidine1402-2'-O)-methyltransferase